MAPKRSYECVEDNHDKQDVDIHERFSFLHPSDIWRHIFEFLDFRSKCQVEMTCRYCICIQMLKRRDLSGHVMDRSAAELMFQWHPSLWTFDNEPRIGQYLHKHPKLHVHLRAWLVDWMFKICVSLNLSRAVFHRTAQIVDTYLFYTDDIQRQKLQLVGIAALRLACQLQSVSYIPRSQYLLMLCRDAFTLAEFNDVHERITDVLTQHKLSKLTVLDYLRWMTSKCKLTISQEITANLLVDRGIQEYDVTSRFSPFIIATAAIEWALSPHHIKRRCCGIECARLEACVKELEKHVKRVVSFRNGRRLDFIIKSYKRIWM